MKKTKQKNNKYINKAKKQQIHKQSKKNNANKNKNK